MDHRIDLGRGQAPDFRERPSRLQRVDIRPDRTAALTAHLFYTLLDESVIQGAPPEL